MDEVAPPSNGALRILAAFHTYYSKYRLKASGFTTGLLSMVLVHPKDMEPT